MKFIITVTTVILLFTCFANSQNNKFVKNYSIDAKRVKFASSLVNTINNNCICYVYEFDDDSVNIRKVDFTTDKVEEITLHFPKDYFTKETYTLVDIGVNSSKIVLLFNNLLVVYNNTNHNKIESNYYFKNRYSKFKITEGDTICLIRNYRTCLSESECNNTEVRILEYKDKLFNEINTLKFEFDFIEFTSEIPNSWIDVSNNAKFTLVSDVLKYNVRVINNFNGKEYKVSNLLSNWKDSPELSIFNNRDPYLINNRK